jgi:hypothetical protein
VSRCWVSNKIVLLNDNHGPFNPFGICIGDDEKVNNGDIVRDDSILNNNSYIIIIIANRNRSPNSPVRWSLAELGDKNRNSGITSQHPPSRRNILISSSDSCLVVTVERREVGGMMLELYS